MSGNGPNLVDSRLIDDTFPGEAQAESSKSARIHKQDIDDGASLRSDDDEEDLSDEDVLGLAEGMDPEGFSGPAKIVEPLTRDALAAFNAAQERTGVIYISRIPPGMRPTKVRHLMSGYGEIGRVYLQQEGAILGLFCRTLKLIVFHLKKMQKALI